MATEIRLPTLRRRSPAKLVLDSITPSTQNGKTRAFSVTPPTWATTHRKRRRSSMRCGEGNAQAAVAGEPQRIFLRARSRWTASSCSERNMPTVTWANGLSPEGRPLAFQIWNRLRRVAACAVARGRIELVLDLVHPVTGLYTCRPRQVRSLHEDSDGVGRWEGLHGRLLCPGTR